MACVLALIPFIAMAYVYGLHEVTLVHGNILLTMLFGAFIGGLMIQVVWLAKVRSRKIAFYLSMLALVYGYVIHWAIWLSYTMGDFTTAETVSLSLGLLQDPALMGNMILETSGTGTWSIKGGSLVSGFFLWVIWLLEALVLFMLSTIAGFIATDRPFCEISGRWSKKIKLPKKQFAYLLHPQELVQQLEKGHYELLKNLPFQPNDNQSYSEISLYHCEGSQVHYLSMDNMLVTIGSNGKATRELKTLITHLEIDLLVAQELVRKCAADLPVKS